MNKQLGKLPHWDLSNVYSGLEAEDFNAAVEDLKQKIADLDQFMKEQGMAAGAADDQPAKTLATAAGGYLGRMNDALRLYSTLIAYVYSFVSTDSYNTLAKKKLSELELLGVSLEHQEVGFKIWLREAVASEDRLEEILHLNETAGGHAYYLKETLEQTRYMMSQAEETLAAELSLSGGTAWQKLQGTVTSQVKAPFEREGKTEELPISAIQNLRTDPDESVRRRAYEVEVAAWEGVREPLAACLNGVKGTVITLNKRRGREDALHAALDQARIDRETLQAMLDVMRASFPDFRRYFKAKASLIGKDSLDWWDLFAPTGEASKSYAYDEAQRFILDHFQGFSERLASFAQRAFEHNWIDAEPRDGKSGGGFCMDVPLVDESRILVNYDGSFDQLSTIAHELGHAFHTECQVGKTILQAVTPMTLAETASIFNQTLITDAALAQAESEQEELAILENFLIDSSQVIVDIYSRFLFEKGVFERRESSELSADDFCAMMLEAQQETYGEGLNADHRHAYMWAWKSHYYSPNRSFYNFPYAFGLLFGLGLFAIYQERGDAFLEDYEQLLRSTGEAKAADLAARFGIDLRGEEFWESSMQVIRRRIDRYCELSASLS